MNNWKTAQIWNYFQQWDNIFQIEYVYSYQRYFSINVTITRLKYMKYLILILLKNIYSIKELKTIKMKSYVIHGYNDFLVFIIGLIPMPKYVNT